jgi:ankyrin repeat protein
LSGPNRNSKFIDMHFQKIPIENGNGLLHQHMITEDLKTPLHLATYRKDENEVRSLFDQGVEIDARNSAGRTPLHIAALTGVWNIAWELLDHKANVNLQDHDGQTALHIASERGDFDLVELLLVKRADVKIKDNDGRTALHIASEGKAKTVVEILIRFQSEVNSKDQFLEAPLHLAIGRIKVNLPIVKVLLQSGADPNIKDGEGVTPLQQATCDGKTDVVHLLLQYKIDVDVKDGNEHTALHLACLFGYKDITELLLAHGADAKVEAPDGTPFQIATYRGWSEISDLLRQYEAKTEPGPTSPQGISSTGPKEQEQQPDGENSSNRETLELKQEISGETAEAEAHEIASLLGDFRAEKIHWEGVRRENGDGFILAKYDKHDVFFDAKLESIQASVHDGEEMHAIQLKLNFMKPFATKNRIRYANVDVALGAAATSGLGVSIEPHIHTVMPQADRVEVSDQEITSGQKLTLGASGNGGPSNVNISMEGSKERKSTFKGVRIIHGVVKDKLHASWRLYEEPGSKSGLPEIVRLLLIVQCETEFMMRLSLSAKVGHFSSFGIPRTLTAREGSSYQVPKVTTISSLERVARLRHMMNLADRTAGIIETARKLEKGFTQSIKNDPKRAALVTEAGEDQTYVQEWMDIADVSKSDYYYEILREKLLRMGDLESRRRIIEIIEQEPRVQTDEFEEIQLPARHRFRSRYRSRTRSSRVRSPSPIIRREYTRPNRRATWDESVREDIPYISSRPRDVVSAQPRNALHSFSAVGPAYKVAHMS